MCSKIFNHFFKFGFPHSSNPTPPRPYFPLPLSHGPDAQQQLMKLLKCS